MQTYIKHRQIIRKDMKSSLRKHKTYSFNKIYNFFVYRKLLDGPVTRKKQGQTRG